MCTSRFGASEPTRTHHKYVWLGSGRPQTEPYIPLVLADQFGRPIPRSEVQVLHFRSRHWPAELVGCSWNAFHEHATDSAGEYRGRKRKTCAFDRGIRWPNWSKLLVARGRRTHAQQARKTAVFGATTSANCCSLQWREQHYITIISSYLLS